MAESLSAELAIIGYDVKQIATLVLVVPFRVRIRERTVPPDVGLSTPHFERLTLVRLMGVIAGLALAFKFLPVIISSAVAVAVLGILALDGIHARLVTSRGGAWRWLPWLFWSLLLVACPVAVAVIGAAYEHTGTPLYDGPRPLATRVVDALGVAHLIISVIATVGVAALTRGVYRWLAWTAVLAIGLITPLLMLGAAMSTLGVSL